tara:strand:- start:1020 stop:1517 length:498 start_codon:yes stop_codon:yes gene_type:complete
MPFTFGQINHMMMQKVKIEKFKVIGISVRTYNINYQAQQDIGLLWQSLFSENIINKIPNKESTDIYCVYTNFEGDLTLPYDTILGCKVSSLEDIPDGMVGHQIEGSSYIQHLANGNVNEGVVARAWAEIWEKDFNRSYTSGFDVYGDKARNPEDAEVDIFVAVKR